MMHEENLNRHPLRGQQRSSDDTDNDSRRTDPGYCNAYDPPMTLVQDGKMQGHFEAVV